MTRAERRQWARESWPRWEKLINFRKHTRIQYPRWGWTHAEPRKGSEQIAMIDQILKDLENPKEA